VSTINVLQVWESHSFILMAQREYPKDFNVFGYDPRGQAGQVANISGLAFTVLFYTTSSVHR
jgi:hypothetical protein